MTSETRGTLYLIPVSIGESPLARYQTEYTLELLRRLSVFVVEQARTARQYIKSVVPDRTIADLTIYEIDKHKGYSYPQEVMEHLKQGEDVGLMSEAGCPAVADPGHLVVAEAHRCGIRVVPLVGPSSILLSLMASGFNGQCFSFSGYLPHDKSSRRERLSQMIHRAKSYAETQIFIEAPYRNDRLLEELIGLLPQDFKLCVAVDLTTEREEISVRSVAAWRAQKSLPGYHKRPAIFLLSAT